MTTFASSSVYVVVVVVLLLSVHGQTAMVMAEQSVNLTTLFLGRLRPTKQLTSTQCPLYMY